MKIYVGNLSSAASETTLRAMFEPHGRVKAARLAKDRETGAPRGFGYVLMDDGAARAAIGALHGTAAEGRTLKVRQAKKRPASPDQNGAVKPSAPPPADGQL